MQNSMPEQTRLEIDEDIVQQQRMWRIERVGWALMALVLLAALLGFMGHGLFSERSAGTPEAGFVVTYHRFERYAAPTLLSVWLTTDNGGETRLRVSQEFLRKIEQLHVDPEPERVELDSGFDTYVFRTRAPGPIVFHYEPTSAGSMAIMLGLEDGPLQTVHQFVYP
jgi:hypothetical protein